MDTVNWKVTVIAIGLTVLGAGTIAHYQIRQRLKGLSEQGGIDPEPKDKKEKVIIPKYRVLDEDVYDSPIKAQIELNMLISGEISEAGLRTLLKKLYSYAKAKRGFKYHRSPTNIYIYAFTSKEKAESGMGQWIAMLQMSHGDIRPRISINKRQIAQLGAKPEEKFGLSEGKRKQIFYELVIAGDNATELAIRKHPNDIMKQIDYENKIREANEQKVREKYNITKQQMYKIKGEGATKNWPFPK